MLELLIGKPRASVLTHSAAPVETPTEEYTCLAKKLGVTVPDVAVQSDLRAVLSAEAIPVYDFDAVFKYMSRKTPHGKVWGWRPLRSIDRQLADRGVSRVTFGYNDTNGRFLEGTYSKAVPLPVLLTIEHIQDATKHCDSKLQAAFFVSDYEVRRPDPFLMVACPSIDVIQRADTGGKYRLWTALKENCFVVERWDEPSFR